MAQVTSEMASEYERIFSKTAEDPGTAGDEGEENWAQLLREWLPPAYHVTTKGRLIAADGTMSPQIDVLVLKPFYPRKLREKKIWLANGVAAAFECKTTLRAEHISAERCAKFKSLFPRRTGSPARELRSPLFYGILAHSHNWKAPASKPVDNVDNAISQEIDKTHHPADLIDLLCIADTGCWSSMMVPYYNLTWGQPRNSHSQTSSMENWIPISSMMRSVIHSDSQIEFFQPVGAMLAYLTQRLAWDDASIRALADYYRLANLWGHGQGQIRHWPQSVLSDDVRQKITDGMIANGGEWNEYSAAIF